jgi:hypothetical protein
VEGAAEPDTYVGLRYDVDFFPSATDIRLNGGMHPTNYGNVQPRVGLAYSFRQGKGVVRAAFGLYTGPFDYSDIMVGWQGASAFTSMNQPILPEFANPAKDLVGLGPSGIVGVSGPFLASQAFANLAHNGAYPDPATLRQFPLGYVKRKFPNPYAEEKSLEVENEIAKNLFVSAGYQFVHGLKPPCTSAPAECQWHASDRRPVLPPAPTLTTLEATPTATHLSAGMLSVRKLFAQHYSVLANYTYSKSIISTDIQLTDTPMDYHPDDRSRGQRRASSPGADLNGRTLISESRLRNFVSMLNTLQSLRYYTVLAGFDVNGDQYHFRSMATLGALTGAIRRIRLTYACKECSAD